MEQDVILTESDQKEFLELYGYFSDDSDLTMEEMLEAFDDADTWEEFLEELELDEGLMDKIKEYGKSAVKRFQDLKSKIAGNKNKTVVWVDGKPKIQNKDKAAGRSRRGKGKGRRKKRTSGSKRDTTKAKKLLGQSFDASLAKEDIDALFSADEFSDEFKSRAATILEAAVGKRVNNIISSYQSQLDEEQKDQEEQIQDVEEITEQVDKYLNYVVEEWMDENKMAIESGIQNELTEQFINGLKVLFKESYIDIPEEKVDVVEKLTEKVESLTAELNKERNFVVEMKDVIDSLRQQSIIEESVSGMVQTDAEKIKELASSVEYISEEDFKEKVETLKESYFPTERKVLTEDVVEDDPVKQVSGNMGVYTSTLDRMLS
tara:strand:+ start:7490 stop:8617 length:1128 start_codon:yes stop_codon:yes gene_type:complete